MKKVDMHGMKMIGLKKASQETHCYGNSNFHDEIFYDCDTGEVWTRFQFSCNTWTQYRDKSVIKVCNAYSHMTMQQIADAIVGALNKGGQEI